MASKVIKCTTCNIVVCELLAFIQNKVDVMDEEGLVRLCTSAFSDEEIESGKSLLFASVSTQQRKIARKNNGKSQRNIYDMISLFKQTDPEQVPIFVAKDLHKLPPVTFDHIDATRTLRDILTIQNEIKVMKETYVTEKQLSEIRNDLQNLKKTSIVNNFDLNINRKRGGGGGIESFCFDSGPMGLPHIEKSQSQNVCSESQYIKNVTTADESGKSSPSTSKVPESCSPICAAKLPISFTPVCKTSEASHFVSATAAKPERDRDASAAGASEMQRLTGPADSGRSKQKTLAEVVIADGDWKKETFSEEWHIAQRKRSRNRLQGHTGKAVTLPDVKFRAAETKVPLFINNVNTATTPTDIIEYIQQKTNVSVSLKKINMVKQKRYDAYKIFVPHAKLAMFLDDCLWPEDIKFRKFIYYNRNTYDKNKEMRVLRNDEKLIVNE